MELADGDFQIWELDAVKLQSTNKILINGKVLYPIYREWRYSDRHLYCAPGGIRTPNPLIRSQSLCPLSYEGVSSANYTAFQFSKPESTFSHLFPLFFSIMQCVTPRSMLH